jgi:tRNA A-37 threonylcarbamoyl transferase component Bud32
MIASDPTVVWTLPSQYRSILLNSNGQLRLNEWLPKKIATIVKQAPHRTIYRIQHPPFDFFLKEYRAVGLRGRLREFIRPVKAESECSKASLLLSRGIAVPRAIGWGVLGPRWSPQASFLLSETVTSAVPLTEYLNGPLTTEERQSIARSLASFVARLHKSGAIHRDFHPANLLIRKDARGLPEYFLIDLHELRVNGSGSWRDRRHNLVTLNRWFILRSSRSDRLRFWRAYESRTSLPDRPDALPEALEEATRRSNAEFWKTRKKRFGPSSRHVEPLHHGSVSGLIMSNAIDELGPLLENNPEQLFTDETTTTLKDGRASTVARIVRKDQSWILKRFNVRSWLDPWKNRFRKSPALRSWLFGHALIGAGLPTAQPLAILHRYQFGLPAAGYLITEELPDVVDLRAFADRILEIPARDRQKLLRARIDVTARLLREFHSRYFGHRDFKAANLLTPVASDDHRIWFIDLVGMHWQHKIRSRARIRDLSRLLASFLNHPVLTRADRLRFLRCYQNWNIHGKTGWKRWWRELGENAQSKVARNQRLGRPLA